jgi:hypothetical protein
VYVNVVSSDAWDIVTVRIQHHTDLNLGRGRLRGHFLIQHHILLTVTFSRVGKGLKGEDFIVNDGTHG